MMKTIKTAVRGCELKPPIENELAIQGLSVRDLEGTFCGACQRRDFKLLNVRHRDKGNSGWIKIIINQIVLRITRMERRAVVYYKYSIDRRTL